MIDNSFGHIIFYIDHNLLPFNEPLSVFFVSLNIYTMHNISKTIVPIVPARADTKIASIITSGNNMIQLTSTEAIIQHVF